MGKSTDYIIVFLAGLAMLPYLLYIAWVRIIALKKESKCQDLALRGLE